MMIGSGSSGKTGSGTSGSMQMIPINFSKPNVGVSDLGHAFIPVIQKNADLSSKFATSGGYIQVCI
jgi:hypothetical protein